jgi:hypothetical protein
MGNIKHLLVIPAAVAVLAALYLVFRIAASAMQGYSWQEMDWQQRGTTSIMDFFKASEIGKRDVEERRFAPEDSLFQVTTPPRPRAAGCC